MHEIYKMHNMYNIQTIYEVQNIQHPMPLGNKLLRNEELGSRFCRWLLKLLRNEGLRRASAKCASSGRKHTRLKMLMYAHVAREWLQIDPQGLLKKCSEGPVARCLSYQMPASVSINKKWCPSPEPALRISYFMRGCIYIYYIYI